MGWKFGQTFEMTVVSNVLNYVCIYIYIYIFAATNSFAILFSLPRLTVTETDNSKKRKKKKKKKGYTNFKPHFKAARQRKEIQRAPKEDI